MTNEQAGYKRCHANRKTMAYDCANKVSIRDFAHRFTQGFWFLHVNICWQLVKVAVHRMADGKCDEGSQQAKEGRKDFTSHGIKFVFDDQYGIRSLVEQTAS